MCWPASRSSCVLHVHVMMRVISLRKPVHWRGQPFAWRLRYATSAVVFRKSEAQGKFIFWGSVIKERGGVEAAHAPPVSLGSSMFFKTRFYGIVSITIPKWSAVGWEEEKEKKFKGSNAVCPLTPCVLVDRHFSFYDSLYVVQSFHNVSLGTPRWQAIRSCRVDTTSGSSLGGRRPKAVVLRFVATWHLPRAQ